MEDGDELTTDPNLSCHVCGEFQFTLREGFYYCQECGTKQEQVRAVEVVHEEELSGGKHLRKQKIAAIKSEKPNLTSWECYNYILHGLVNDLLSLGAKEDLKLMTLQIWAAYLRRMEVAFFSKRHVELPKLGIRFLQRDASALYNHALEKRATKRKRRKSIDSGQSVSEASTNREHRRNKRKLDESTYSSLDITSNSSLNTSSTGTTGHAIKLQFSARARKHLKKVMPVKHIDKHALDANNVMKCHNMKPLARDINRSEYALCTMNPRQIFTILAIALNLIGDEIQLCDLLRFMDEEHITTKKVLKYFPDNIAPHCNEILQEIQFFKYPTKYSDKVLREHVGLLSKFTHIREFNQPDLIKLSKRYVTELNLPTDMATHVERLINLLPPKMGTRIKYVYPAYEARSMAYIIFVLKLLFGLDGHTEKLISFSAHKINQRLEQLSEEGGSTNQSPPPLLFVWEHWVEFIEMRKIIVAHYNKNFCRQFKQCQSTAQLIEEMNEEQKIYTAEDAAPEHTPKVAVMHKIFEEFIDEYSKIVPPERVQCITFPPSLTPAHSYFKRILLHCSNADTSTSLTIPEFMHTDHMQRTLAPFTYSKELKQYLKFHKCELKVLRVRCTNRRTFAGIFHSVYERKIRPKTEMCTKKANLNISNENWLTSLKYEGLINELEFKTKFDRYEKQYLKKLRAEALKRQPAIYEGNAARPLNNSSYIDCVDNGDNENSIPMPSQNNERVDVQDVPSIDVFSEMDMDPMKELNLPVPRRGLNKINIFADLSDDESDVETTAEAESYEDIKERIRNNENKENPTETLLTSNMDYWALLGYPHVMTGVQKKILESKFSRSFFWLLETCAQTINVDWCAIYEQLLIIEVMFAYGIEDLNNYKDCVRFKQHNPIKDFNMMINVYRELW